jgi:predicted restriction endonuclease
MRGKPWTRDELLLVMNLYCRIPFGKYDQNTNDVKDLAAVLGRSSGSVAMKLNNLASLDSAHQARGVGGLQNTSKLDRAVWAEFHEDWEKLTAESEMLWQERVENRPATPEEPEPEVEFTGATETVREVTVRLAQKFFRRTVVAGYGRQCCVSGIALPELLVASHIVPWSRSPRDRANPRNGLCLSRLHDGAFDRGLITFDEEFRLVLSARLSDACDGPVLNAAFRSFEGQPLNAPSRFSPDAALMEQHRNTVFVEK